MSSYPLPQLCKALLSARSGHWEQGGIKDPLGEDARERRHHLAMGEERQEQRQEPGRELHWSCPKERHLPYHRF